MDRVGCSSGCSSSGRLDPISRGDSTAGGEQSRELLDVVESVDVKDGFFDGRLALGRNQTTCQLRVLVTNFVVGQIPVAGAARVHDFGNLGASVLQRQAHLRGVSLVDPGPAGTGR